MSNIEPSEYAGLFSALFKLERSAFRIELDSLPPTPLLQVFVFSGFFKL